MSLAFRFVDGRGVIFYGDGRILSAKATLAFLAFTTRDAFMTSS
jgi:hypothetical protein